MPGEAHLSPLILRPSTRRSATLLLENRTLPPKKLHPASPETALL